jgi:hypothetical protein
MTAAVAQLSAGTMDTIRHSRRAVMDASAAQRPTPGHVYLRAIAQALEKALQQDPDCAVHWIDVVGERSAFGQPADEEVWKPEFDDFLVQVGLTQGNSEGMLLYVHVQPDRYKPDGLVALLRIKLLCGVERAAKELASVHRWFASEAFSDLLAAERSWTTFGDLNLGTIFFDPQSGETWEKSSGLHAICRSGGDALEGNSDEFDRDAHVQVLVPSKQAPAT